METNGEHPLVLAFLQALRSRQLEQCQRVLGELEAEAVQAPALAPWAAYLKGVLANERDQDWGEAERIFCDLLASEHDIESALEARVLLALGITYGYQGRWHDVIDACGRSLALYETLGRPFDQANAIKQMVVAYSAGFTQGFFGADVLPLARTHCLVALQLLATLAEETPREQWLQGVLWNELGILCKNMGDFEQAIVCYQRYLENSRSLNHSLGIAFALTNLAEVHHLQGPQSWPAALSSLREALALKQVHGSRYQEVETQANLGFLLQTMGDLPAAASTYDETIALISHLRSGTSTARARIGFQATVIDSYANAVITSIQLGRNQHVFSIVEQARSRAFLDLLDRGSLDLQRRWQGETLDLAEVQARLPANGLLLEYFTTGVLEAVENRRNEMQGTRHRFPPSKSFLLAVTRFEIRAVDTGLDPNDLLPRRLQGVTQHHFLNPAIRRTLYDRLIGPVEDLLAGKKVIAIAPHGPLHYVPFHALMAPDGETLLRTGGPELVYGPSASVLFRHRSARSLEASETPRAWQTACLALGYNGAGSQRLSFAEDEAMAVAGLLGGEALIGPASKREALFQRGPAARYLHITCHGEFDPAAPLDSLLHLGVSETLTAQDVMENLRLSCDLVTLSACESGLSRVRRGDELMGLVRAFMVAGAPAVIATLWRVDERSTRLLMERFYRLVAAGAGFAQALAQAQRYLRTLSREEALSLLGGDALGEPGSVSADTPFADPFYWAPFILVGAG